jgi:hypothetical protein
MQLIDYPLVLFVVTLFVLWLGALAGMKGFARMKAQIAGNRDDFGIVQGATLTLLGLIIGFTFSMALTRYDQRKNLEEEEANALGTEFVRADLLPAAEAARLRVQLRDYADLRVRYFTLRRGDELDQVNARTAALQGQMWTLVSAAGIAQPNPMTALVVTGMNDVLNAQGYTQAAWWNRIPVTAWLLMAAIALCSVALVGMGATDRRITSGMQLVLPLVIAIAFMLIADIDSPRSGLIRVSPQNLNTLVDSLKPH